MRGWLWLALGATVVVGACGGGETPAAREGAAPPPGAAMATPDSPDWAAVLDPAEYWNSATIYFLLTDRFANGDPANDRGGRPGGTAVLRGFEGGDLRGVIQKLEEGWFRDLHVDAIWMTPFWEQIRGSVDEGTGVSQGYHGYWARDWTAVDPSLGSYDDLAELVALAHEQGIRVIMDAVIQHTGPVTDRDPLWTGWVRDEPTCTYRGYVTTVDCTLVDNLPDVLTDSDREVELPDFLLEKWRIEGRAEEELAQLDAWFAETGYPRAPRYYILKWLADWVRELGFDAWRVDTVKHFEESVSAEMAAEGARALEAWRAANPDRAVGDLPFWMMGEVYGYGASGGRDFDFGDRTVDYFDFGYDALINFGFKAEAEGGVDALEAVYARYADLLNGGELEGVSIVNYIASHDDGSPLDRDRDEPFFTSAKLMLAPGAAQIYYGDETLRPLRIEGAEGDANLRSFMNWEALESDDLAAGVLEHWQALAAFRARHPAVGAGEHRMIQAEPYVFSRVLEWEGGRDAIVAGVGLPLGEKVIPVGGVFQDGTTVVEARSGEMALVRDGRVELGGTGEVVLLEAATRQP